MPTQANAFPPITTRRRRAKQTGGWYGRTPHTAHRRCLACPNPVVDSSLLVNTAGKDLILRLSVDVTSGHVEPSRTFTITAV